MIPHTFKGKLFCLLTFMNVGLSSYFFALELNEQAMLSVTSSFLCLMVWLSEEQPN
jgi:hypothetical protein